MRKAVTVKVSELRPADQCTQSFCGQFTLQDPKIPIQSYNHVLQVNLPFAKFFLSMEMGELVVLHSYYTDMQDIGYPDHSL